MKPLVLPGLIRGSGLVVPHPPFFSLSVYTEIPLNLPLFYKEPRKSRFLPFLFCKKLRKKNLQL